MNLDEMPKRPANWNQVSTCTYTTLTYGQPTASLSSYRDRPMQVALFSHWAQLARMHT
jgi:hypothetical protein